MDEPDWACFPVLLTLPAANCLPVNEPCIETCSHKAQERTYSACSSVHLTSLTHYHTSIALDAGWLDGVLEQFEEAQQHNVLHSVLRADDRWDALQASAR